MTEASQILEEAHSVLVVGAPSEDVPDTLARAGFDVLVRGAEPTKYAARELVDGEISERPAGLPERLDLVYVHCPVQELPGTVMIARSLGAKAVWFQSGRTQGGASDPKGCWLPEDEELQARQTVEAAELAYVGDVYIADAVRESTTQK